MNEDNVERLVEKCCDVLEPLSEEAGSLFLKGLDNMVAGQTDPWEAFREFNSITDTQEPIDSLFEKWKTIRAKYNSKIDDEAEADALFKELLRKEAQILETPPNSVREFALKTLVAKGDVDMGSSKNITALMLEAETFAGSPIT